MAKRIVFFNHKGGVSKTTTAYNLGWKLAEDDRVLLVDADPQCNLTSLIIENFDSYYLDEATRKNNLRDGVEVAFKGRPAPITAIDCFEVPRRPSLFCSGIVNMATVFWAFQYCCSAATGGKPLLCA